jgi:Ribonuclease E/G family
MHQAIRLTEWFYEDGIGEERAILVDKGSIIAGRIQHKDDIQPGLVAQAQLVTKLVAETRGILRLENGAELLLTPLPKGLCEGASLMVEVTRGAIHEQSRFKLPVARAAPDTSATAAPSLLHQIEATDFKVTRCLPHEEDRFEQAGWGELLEEARTGIVRFDIGTLHISVTPAMTLFDVDGDTTGPSLALGAANAIATAIRRLDIQGNIGIDFPTLAEKSDRQKVAEAFDAAMQGPCERTAINGFGFMQVVTRRRRPSLPEMLRYRRLTCCALSLLRMAERNRNAGPMTLVAHSRVLELLETKPLWIEQLVKRTGRTVALCKDNLLAIEVGYVA